MKREEALRRIAEKPYDESTISQDFEYVATKLGFTVSEFRELMNGSNKTYRDYKSRAALIALGTRMSRILGIEKRLIR